MMSSKSLSWTCLPWYSPLKTGSLKLIPIWLHKGFLLSALEPLIYERVGKLTSTYLRGLLVSPILAVAKYLVDPVENAFLSRIERESCDTKGLLQGTVCQVSYRYRNRQSTQPWLGQNTRRHWAVLNIPALCCWQERGKERAVQVPLDLTQIEKGVLLFPSILEMFSTPKATRI